MQSDLLSPHREEQLPESLSAQELTQPEPRSVPDATPLEPTLRVGAVSPAPATQKKRSTLNIAVLGLVVLVILLFLASSWVGYWAYTLNTTLTTTQGQLAALQAEHAKLQTDYATLTSENQKLNAELTQVKATLEKANTDLDTAQADLSKSMQQGEKLENQIDASGKLAEILFVWTTVDNPSDIFKIDTLINETKNQELISQWNTFTNSPSDDAFAGFLDYFILAIRNSLR